MKLAPVLAKYLEINKQLNLVGLGSFVIAGTSLESIGSQGDAVVKNIVYTQKKLTTHDDDLVQFVSQETGKMKVLAEADLTSELEAVVQFLNTGKPYTITGIGTLLKNPRGEYIFQNAKPVASEKKTAPAFNESNYVPNINKEHHKSKAGIGKPALILAVLTLLAIATTVWFYINSNKPESNTTTVTENGTPQPKPETAKPADTSRNIVIPPGPAATAPASGNYTFVIETAVQPRAGKRFTQLQKLNWPVALTTKDSIQYKIVMQLPLTVDTTRVKDSLSALSGKKVWIER